MDANPIKLVEALSQIVKIEQTCSFQCPYCTKRFLTSGYLLAHIQRRHQGLPINHSCPSPPPMTELSSGEMEELKTSLQASVQDEFKSLITQLEQLWLEKLASVQTEHQNQIDQLRRELAAATAARQIEIVSPPLDVNPNTKSQQEENNYRESKHDVETSPPSPPPISEELNLEKAEMIHEKSKNMLVQTECSGAHRDASYVDEINALKTSVQATVQDEMKSLISQLEQFWLDKLTTLQISHEKQIQQLRQELQMPPPQHIGDDEVSLSSEQNYVVAFQQELIICEEDEGENETEDAPIHKPSQESGKQEPGKQEPENMPKKKVDSGTGAKRDMPRVDTVTRKASPPQVSSTETISSIATLPKKKKHYVFDQKSRKLLEVSPSGSEDDDDDDEDENSVDRDLNTMTDADDNAKVTRKGKKSQLDLVRAKTIMELEQDMTDIGLNPESTAIGVEEMGRALKHLRFQRRASGDHIHDYEKFEEERNAVKTLAKFEATKSSIDGKLQAISSLNAKKAPESSLVKIFSAVKTSGRKWRKRLFHLHKSKESLEKKQSDKTIDPSFEERTIISEESIQLTTTGHEDASIEQSRSSESVDGDTESALVGEPDLSTDVEDSEITEDEDELIKECDHRLQQRLCREKS